MSVGTVEAVLLVVLQMFGGMPPPVEIGDGPEAALGHPIETVCALHLGRDPIVREPQIRLHLAEVLLHIQVQPVDTRAHRAVQVPPITLEKLPVQTSALRDRNVPHHPQIVFFVHSYLLAQSPFRS
ncbi:hypothetical protein D3C78_953330 [compost metagenome]